MVKILKLYIFLKTFLIEGDDKMGEKVLFLGTGSQEDGSEEAVQIIYQ